MGFRGQTFVIPCIKGGFNHSPNLDTIPPTSFVEPSRNIMMHNGGWEKRRGTQKVNSTAVSGTPEIRGIFDYILNDQSTQFQVFGTSDGSIYKNSTATIKTGMSTSNHFGFIRFNDTLVITDGATIPQTWDGSAGSTSDLTSPAADWTGSSYPAYMIVHGRGSARRPWAFGLPSNPESIYAAAIDSLNFADPIKIKIETGTGFGLVGAAEFGDRLFMFSKNKPYLIEDSDLSPINWGSVPLQWEGGVAHHRLLCKTANDLLAMTEDGEIYSVRSAQNYGDYVSASITRPSYMHSWISDNVNLAQIDKFHCIYHPVLRATLWFVVRAGQTDVDTCLVHYEDRPPEDSWMVWDNSSNDSGFKASSSALVRESVGVYKVYTGSYDGFIWELHNSTKNDDANAYASPIRSPQLSFGNPRDKKNFVRGRLNFSVRGDYDVTVSVWVDGVKQTDQTISTSGQGAVFGSAVFGTDVFSGQEISEGDFDIRMVGRLLQVQFDNAVAGEDFFLTNFMIDYLPLGKKAGT